VKKTTFAHNQKPQFKCELAKSAANLGILNGRLIVNADNIALARLHIADLFGENCFDQLTLSRLYGQDISFLAEVPLLESLIINRCEALNLKALEKLAHLKTLILYDDLGHIDLQKLPRLEEFSFVVTKSIFDQIHSVPNLKKLKIQKMKVCDAIVLNLPVSLENLHITQCQFGMIDFMNTLPRLGNFEVAYCPKLTEINFSSFMPKLSRLSFEKLPAYSCYPKIGHLESLAELIMDSCASIANLDWISSLVPCLKTFVALDTNVEDGNLRPLINLINLEHIEITNKKHFNLKAKDIQKLIVENRK